MIPVCRLASLFALSSVLGGCALTSVLRPPDPLDPVVEQTLHDQHKEIHRQHHEAAMAAHAEAVRLHQEMVPPPAERPIP